MRIGLVGFAVSLCLCNLQAALAGDCAVEAKAALNARLGALPAREILESDRDGEHQRIELELETLQRFHMTMKGEPEGGAPAVELLILDGQGWSRDKGHWLAFAAAQATAESTADDERTLADQLTDGATVECLGASVQGGRDVVGYRLSMDGDPSTGAPYQTMQLYVDATSHLPVSYDTAGQGETGPATSHESFAYDKSLKLTPPE